MRIRFLGALLVWLGAVVVVAVVASFAINAAGRQVIADPIAPSLVGAPLATTASDEIRTVPPSPTSSPRSAPSKSPAKSTRLRRSVTPTTGSSEPAITQEHTRVAVESTYSTDAGRVRVRCDGSRVTLNGGYAQPATGWSVRIRDAGPDQVRVRFARDGEPSLVVVAICVDERPMFDQFRLDRNRDSGDRDRDRSRHRYGR